MVPSIDNIKRLYRGLVPSLEDQQVFTVDLCNMTHIEIHNLNLCFYEYEVC
jgi:hypothetical protein